MKRLLHTCLVPVLICAVCVGVSAAQVGSKEIDVNARFQSVSTTPASYSVDLSWTDMTFTFTREDTHIWNPSDHSYKTRSRSGWDRTRGTVTVTNHSNVDIRVKVTYESVEGMGVTGTLRNASDKLKAGAVGDYAGADSMTATLVISGTPDEAVTASGAKVGSLKVTIQ